MYESIHLHIKCCHACAQYPICRRKPAGHLQPVPPPEPSSSDNRYTIVLTNYLTKYFVAKAVLKNTALATAEFLLETALVFDVPSRIITDQGTHFSNELMGSLVSSLGCQYTLITPYHPKSNGQVERWNATILPKLNVLHDKNLNNWDDYLKGIVSAYNTGIHTSIGYSPSYLIFDRDIALSFDPVRPIITSRKPSDFLTFLKRYRAIVLEAAWSNISFIANNWQRLDMINIKKTHTTISMS